MLISIENGEHYRELGDHHYLCVCTVRIKDPSITAEVGLTRMLGGTNASVAE